MTRAVSQQAPRESVPANFGPSTFGLQHWLRKQNDFRPLYFFSFISSAIVVAASFALGHNTSSLYVVRHFRKTRQTMESGQMRNGMCLVFIKRSLFLALVFLLATEQCNATKPAVFPLPPFRDVLIVPVSIAGEDHLFVLDTGATVNVFDSNLRKLLGEPIRRIDLPDDLGKKLEGEAFAPPIAHVGEVAVTREALVACADLTSIRAATGRQIMGILGMPFFATNIVQVDFDQRQLSILPGSAIPRAEWGEPVDVVFTESNLPVVHTRFPTYGEEPCVVDLGFSSTLSVRAGLFDYLLKSDEILVTTTTETMTIGGRFKSDKGLLSKLEFCGNSHKSLPIIRSQSDSSRVGVDYFRRYLVTFDLGRGQIYLAKGFHFNDLEELEPIGVAMLREDGKTVVKNVVSKSPAEKSGFQTDDELLSVAGQDISGKPMAEIRWMISMAMKTDGNVKVAIRRGGLTQSVTVNATE